MKIAFLLFFINIISANILAIPKIENILITKTGNNWAEGEIKFSEGINEIPELTFRDSLIQIVIPKTIAWPKIEKKASLLESDDTTVMAYQYDKDNTRFRVMLPYEISSNQEDVSLKIEKNLIKFKFPILAAKKTTGFGAAMTKTTKHNKEDFDESYLKKLLSENEEAQAIVDKKEEIKESTLFGKKEKTKSEDQVKITQAATDKKQFSLMTYVGKFVSFFALVILGLWGVMTLFKKGVFRKTKLSFLKNSTNVQILNTTFIGPKKSVLVIKAHKQIFLVGNSEAGLQLISELDDVASLMRETEKEVSGKNFDTELDKANTTEKEFVLKEDITQSQPEKKTVSKLTDQIKSKVSKLKSLQ